MGGNAKKTGFSPEQQMVLAIVPKFSATLSIIGSAWIIFEVLRDRRKLRLIYHRLMLEMSAWCLLVNFTAHFLSTWPIPEGTPNVYFAAGTTATCTAQGFFFQLGLPGAIVSQAFLAAYFLLVLRYNWNEERLVILERASLGFCASLGAGTAVAGLVLRLFNSANYWCWIAPWPTGCKGDACLRGINAWMYRFAFYYAWSWGALLVVAFIMALLYYTVHQQVKRAKKYSGGGWLDRKKNQVAHQAIYYIFAFLSVSFFASLGRIIQATTGDTYFWVALLKMIFTPLRGFWNGLIYLRPRYMNYREKHPDWKPRHIIRRVILRAGGGQRGSSGQQDADHKLGHLESDGLNSHSMATTRISDMSHGCRESMFGEDQHIVQVRRMYSLESQGRRDSGDDLQVGNTESAVKEGGSSKGRCEGGDFSPPPIEPPVSPSETVAASSPLPLQSPRTRNSSRSVVAANEDQHIDLQTIDESDEEDGQLNNEGVPSETDDFQGDDI